MFHILTLTQKMIRHNGILWGTLCLLISFSVFLINPSLDNGLILGIGYAFFDIGVIVVCDYIDLKLSGSSLLINKKNLSFYRTFVFVTVLGALLLELLINFLSKNWIFPYFNYLTFAVLFIPGYILYTLTIAESYFATKTVLDKLWKKPVLSIVKPDTIKIIFKIVMIISMIGLVSGLSYLISIYVRKDGYFHEINKPVEFQSTYLILVILSFSLWGLFEFIGYRQGKNTLIKDCLRGYWTPLIAVLLASIWLGLSMEIWNVTIQFWTYTNLPSPEFYILGVSLWIYLGWPLHYIPFLSLYRIFSKKVAEDPWEIDKIKTS